MFGADPTHGEASREALRRCLAEGSVIACEAVFAEVAACFGDPGDALAQLAALPVGFSPLGEQAALLAGASFRDYRRRGGNRDQVVADFLIGAHAADEADRLLTRDRGFYRAYFKGLNLVDPGS